MGNQEETESATPRLSADQLRKKRPRREEISFVTIDDDGNETEGTLLLEALSASAYDDLVSRHQPDENQRKKGMRHNSETFIPALLSRVCIDPQLTEEEWRDIWNSPDWNRGELQELAEAAVRVCTHPTKLPFI